MDDGPSHQLESRRVEPSGGHDSMDDVIALYQRDIDMTLVRQRLAMTVEERFESHERARRLAEELRRAGAEARTNPKP